MLKRMTRIRIAKRSHSTIPFEANGIKYNPPNAAVVVICIDGCENEYLDVSLNRNMMPNLSKLLSSGSFRFMCKGALPSFTNVNNCGIITGCPPFRHGISGNYFVDSDNNEVMMNSNKYLQCENILEKALLSGRKVCMITAKDKLRDLLGGNNIIKSRPNGIALSTEFLKNASFENNGIEYEYIVNKLMKNDKTFASSYINDTFSIYSGESSINVLKLGVKLIENGLSDFAYLSLSDYIQHKYNPFQQEALEFYNQIDQQIGYLMDLNCTIGITADHGMNDKSKIIYLQQLLNKEFGNGIRVICPITDPYVVHHGSLGSFVYVYIDNELNDEDDLDFVEYRQCIMDYIESLDGVKEIFCKESATFILQLPNDRIGDITVISDKDVAIGKTPNDHELDYIQNGLRSHGGRTEEMVPFIINKSLNGKYSQLVYQHELRNFNIFEFTCNGT